MPDSPVQAGVGVCHQDRDDVPLLGEVVARVGHHNDGIRRPTHGEDDEYDEQGPGQLHAVPLGTRAERVLHIL